MLSSGFYNSKGGDRKYDAEQFGAMFNGLITDGVFAHYKDALKVAAGSGNRELIVKPGRAWFNGTWTEVDDSGHSIYLMGSAVETTYFVYLAVNKLDRKNTIAWYSNIANNDPEKGLYFYLLAQVTVPGGVTKISDSMITDTRGSDLCPYATGIMETVSFEEIVKRVCGDSWQDWLGVYEAGITTGVQNAVRASSEALSEVKSLKAYSAETEAVSYTWAKFEAIATGGGGFKWATDSVHMELADPPMPVCLFRDLSYADLGAGFKPNISLGSPYIAKGENTVKAIPAVAQSKVWREYPYFWEGGAAYGTEVLRYDDLWRVIVNVGGTASEKYRYRVSRLVPVPVTYKPGAYVGTVTADNATAYPRDGYKDGYWYMRFAAKADDISFYYPGLSAKNVKDAIIEVVKTGGTGGGTAMSIIEVEELPATGVSGVMYVVKKPGESDASEYIWLDRWEKIGGTDYAQNLTLDTTLSKSGAAADAKAVGDKLTELAGKIPGSGQNMTYTGLSDKPKINGVELTGNKTAAELGIEGATDEQVQTAVQEYLAENGVEVEPQWAEFPRITNPALDIKNAVAMDERITLGTDGTLRHNLMIENALISWSESNDNTDNSNGDCHVKLCCWWNAFGNGHSTKTPNIKMSDPVDVFPVGSSILGVDGAEIDTVAASSDSCIIDCGNKSYIIGAICRGAATGHHMVYRRATVASNTVTLGDTVNVLRINGAEWDMSTLREDYTNPLSQINTRIVSTGGHYYMAVVQSHVGVAILKSADGIDWTLANHIPDTDCYIEASIGLVSWSSNKFPCAYVAVRHDYGDGYISLYGLQSPTGDVMTKTLIPAATGRPMLCGGFMDKNLYIAYSVNGRQNAVLGMIMPRSDGTTGISILTTPVGVMSNYPAMWVRESSNGEWFILFGGTDGMNTNKSAVSVAYLWNQDNPNLAEKNAKLRDLMFDDLTTDDSGPTDAVQTVGWVKLGDVTTTEEQTEITIAFGSRKINRLMIYADLKKTETNTEDKCLVASLGNQAKRVLGIGAVSGTKDHKGRVTADLTSEGAMILGSYDAWNDVSDAPIAQSWNTTWKSSMSVESITFTAGTAYSFRNGAFGAGTRILVMAQ